MSPVHREPSQPGSERSPGSRAEEAQLDAAMRRADQLLVASLKSDELRRRRRHWLFLGGVLMAVTTLLVLGSLAWQSTTPPRPTTPAPTVQSVTKPTAAPTDSTADTAPASDPAASKRLAEEGWQLWNSRQYGPAIEKFRESVRLNDRNLNAWNGLGWSQFNSGQLDEAQQAFEHLLKLDPKYAAALNGMGQLLLAQRKYDQAEKYLLKASSQASAAWYGLARIYLLREDFEKAGRWCRKIAASGSSDPGVARMLEAVKQRKLPADLRQLIEPPAQSSAGPQVAKVWQAMNSGNRDEAKRVLEDLLVKAPDDAAVLNAAGWFWLNGGEPGQAQGYFEKALAIEPLAGGAMNGLGRALYDQDQIDRAVEIWQKMVDEIPGPHAGTLNLADVWLEREQYAKAIPLLEQLAQANPADQQLKNKLELARAAQAK